MANNNQPITLYGKQYLGILQTVFAVKAGFSAALAPLQVLDGVSHNKKAFAVKTNGTPVVIGEFLYSQDLSNCKTPVGVPNATPLFLYSQDLSNCKTSS